MNSIWGSEADVPLFTMYMHENQSNRPNWIFVTTQQVKYCLFNAYIIMLQLTSPSWSNKKNWKLYVWLFLELRLFILWTVSTVAHENGSVLCRIDLYSFYVLFSQWKSWKSSWRTVSFKFCLIHVHMYA